MAEVLLHTAPPAAGATSLPPRQKTAEPEDLPWLDEHDPMNQAELIDRMPPSSAFFGEDGLGFGDLLDIVNPLQHLPVISTIYRALTGDEISPGARVAGGALFGGPIGLVASLISGVVEAETGADPGQMIYAAVFGDGTTEAPTALATVAPPPAGAPNAYAAPPLPPPAGTGDDTLPAILAANAILPSGGISPAGAVSPPKGRAAPGAILPASPPPASPSLAMPPLVTQGRPIPTISPRLSAHLAALAERTAEAAAADVAPTGIGAPPHPLANLPPERVPQIMLQALETYERARKLETAGGQS